MFRKVLIANRGEIACRVIRTLRRMGVGSVAVCSEADGRSLHVTTADEAIGVGPAPAGESYLNTANILRAALDSGAEAIHPGYGFLSENAEFAETVEANGIAFIGPTPEQIRKFGLKHTAREIAQASNVPLLPGTGILADVAEAKVAAARIGYPVMLKSTAGGGGIGLRLCTDEESLDRAFEAVARLGASHFKNAGAFLEKYVARARHIEVQVFGDGNGRVVGIGERDCSAQRRNQKVVEETPAPNLDRRRADELAGAAVRLMQAVNYRSAGTVEFIVDAETSDFYFLEVNTRLQVEHCVTEEVRGVDLVEWMVRTAAKEPPAFFDALSPAPKGHSIEVRVYAEDAAKNYQPSSGLLTDVSFPNNVRTETWIESGIEVTPFYDPLLAKIVVWGDTRNAAIAELTQALDATRISGIETNLDYLRTIARSDVFTSGTVTTAFLGTLDYAARGIDVLAPGTQSTIQDYPGRVGYWAVGIPPSGPMDALALRLGNRVLGNAEGAPALEMTMTGATLRFRTPMTVALAGAPMEVTLDGAHVPFWVPIPVQGGQTLAIGAIQDAGLRAYLCVAGGFDVPAYLGSRATFALGGFGGHAGRALKTGDVLHLAGSDASMPSRAARALPADLLPVYARHWDIGVLEGPHAAPDFFAEEFIQSFYDVNWKVHYNSARTGVRLVGPKPIWVREDGGEAGLHPSNIHDTAYAIGAVDFTGDMPIILGPDGPSLGGFVCPVTIVSAELWKMGQLKPGDTVRFRPWSPEAATELEHRVDREIAALVKEPGTAPQIVRAPAILAEVPATGDKVKVAYRRSGDRHLLVEYGPMVLDLKLRVRVHLLMQWLEGRRVPGIVDLTPGIRSLQIHYDDRRLPLSKLRAVLEEAEASIGSLGDVTVPSRVVRMPLSWDDPQTRLAIEKYVQSVRPDAPWAPSNIEFIRRINGLDSIDDVRKIVFDASYLVLGLGDVYLGAPVATPVDPRHRLVTTKYNPARTWTPENAVGIGGAYLCIYGMEGPGGYQFVGRTLQVYNRFKQTASFGDGKPWLLRFFDRIQFYPVEAKELLELREAFIAGRFDVEITDGTFDFGAYERLLVENRESILAFKTRQQRAFDEERERWIKAGQLQFSSETDADEGTSNGVVSLPEGATLVESHVSGSIWKILVEPGAQVTAGTPLVIVESMKMEVTVEAPKNARVLDVVCRQGKPIGAGDPLVILTTSDV
ncbi:MAG TPA: urea carboxylase [Polyangiaceae bacterium]|jgi:urea carboxylase|nr:urea carboxylase [Polyangiaceae bacterium]